MDNINIYPKASIARSYSYSDSEEGFGKKKHETFMSLSYSWFDEYPTDEEIKAKSEELYAQCKALVETAMKEIFGEKDNAPF